ncbi:MAG: hypothetical protein H5T96_09580 [Tissierellales bacterium]|nr:hypothetical protein [Tissierellales bacterium]
MKKKVNELILLNEWLLIYHGVDIDEVKKLHPKWAKAEREYAQINSYPQDKRDKISENMNKATREFLETYSVSDEEYNEWEEWAKAYVKKVTKLPKRYVDRSWWSVVLSVSPMVKQQKEE